MAYSLETMSSLVKTKCRQTQTTTQRTMKQVKLNITLKDRICNEEVRRKATHAMELIEVVVGWPCWKAERRNMDMQDSNVEA